METGTIPVVPGLKLPVFIFAIVVMQEICIDISGHHLKNLTEFFDKDIDIMVTACDGASGICPMFPEAKMTIHQEFLNPSSVSGTDEERKDVFRIVNDEIIDWIDKQVKKEGFCILPDF